MDTAWEENATASPTMPVKTVQPHVPTTKFSTTTSANPNAPQAIKKKNTLKSVKKYQIIALKFSIMTNVFLLVLQEPIRKRKPASLALKIVLNA